MDVSISGMLAGETVVSGEEAYIAAKASKVSPVVPNRETVESDELPTSNAMDERHNDMSDIRMGEPGVAIDSLANSGSGQAVVINDYDHREKGDCPKENDPLSLEDIIDGNDCLEANRGHKRRCLSQPVEVNGRLTPYIALPIHQRQWIPRRLSLEAIRETTPDSSRLDSQRRRRTRDLLGSNDSFFDTVWKDSLTKDTIPLAHHPQHQCGPQSFPLTSRCSSPLEPSDSQLGLACITGQTIASIGHYFNIIPSHISIPIAVFNIIANTVEFRIRRLIQEAKKFSRHSLSSVSRHFALTFSNVFSAMEALNMTLSGSTIPLTIPHGYSFRTPIPHLLSSNVNVSSSEVSCIGAINRFINSILRFPGSS